MQQFRINNSITMGEIVDDEAEADWEGSNPVLDFWVRNRINTLLLHEITYLFLGLESIGTRGCDFGLKIVILAV